MREHINFFRWIHVYGNQEECTHYLVDVRNNVSMCLDKRAENVQVKLFDNAVTLKYIQSQCKKYIRLKLNE